MLQSPGTEDAAGFFENAEKDGSPDYKLIMR